MRGNRFAQAMTLACLLAVLTGCIEAPPVPDARGAITVSGASSVTVPFTFDDNRVFVEITFVEPDGSTRKALAFVNMGSGSFVLTNKLYRELGVGEGKPLRMKIGAMDIAIDQRDVLPEGQADSFTIKLNPFSKSQTAAEAAKGPGGLMAQFSAPMNVEAVISPGLLQNFQAVFDYGAKTMKLAAPGTLKPDGIAVPIRINPKTGFATLDVVIDGKNYPTVIDDGGSYSVFTASTVPDWASAHPAWLRSEGGVGESNYVMSGGVDAGVPVLKIPDAKLGPMPIAELGATAPDTSGLMGAFIGSKFWNWYSDKAGEEVSGWIGGNVLKSFRLTLDYPNRMSYWQQESPIDTHDRDQVGVTLSHGDGKTFIAAIAKKNGAETVSGVQPGDKLLQIDGRDTATMTRGQLLSALHGTPGEKRHLVLERAGKQIEIDAVITAF